MRACLVLSALLLIAPAFNDTEYEVYDLEGIGKFYIDTPNDRVKDRIVEGRIWEPNLVEHLRKHLRPGCTSIDVWAHIGFHTITMARLLPHAGWRHSSRECG